MNTVNAVIPSDRQVPSYTVTDFAPKRHRYCVAIFVINENGRLLRQLDKMKQVGAPLDVVIADGGSTDGSTTEENLSTRGVRTLLVKTGAGKLSAQMRMAFDWAMQQGYEGVVTIDGNDKDGPEALTRFVEALDQGIDHVQGSRYVPGGVAINTPKLRTLGIKILHAPLISLASRFRYTDTRTASAPTAASSCSIRAWIRSATSSRATNCTTTSPSAPRAFPSE